MPRKRDDIGGGPRDRFAGLTPEERQQLKTAEAFMQQQLGGSAQMRRFIKFNVESMRLRFLMTRALEELRRDDQSIYLRIATAAQGDYQRLLDVANKDQEEIQAADPQHLAAPQMLADPTSLTLSPLFANHGFEMRAALIGWLTGKPAAKTVLKLLKDLQKLLPRSNLQGE